MATTKLWHIKGRLKDLLAYVENPEKTMAEKPDLQPLWDVLSYVQRPTATEQGEYVTAVNCLKEIALQQMIQTKKRFGKEDKYIAWHGYQSFQPGEVTPELCHEIGVRLAKEMWGDRFQIIVTTHLDKGHLHKAPPRQVWLDEKAGKPTRYNVYREDVHEAIIYSRNPRLMEAYLLRKGYITDFTGKHWKVRLPQYEHFTRLDTLDERWTPQEISRYMGAAASFGSRPARIDYPRQMPQELHDWFKPFVRTSHIYRQYLHYCYLLGILPNNTEYKPTSPYLKEDLKKLDTFTEQVRYMGKYHIETLEDLYADRKSIESEMDKLTDRRRKLQNKIRRATPEAKVTLREEKTGVTARITELRERLKLNEGIEERSLKMKEKTDLLYANEYRAQEEQQRKKYGRERDTR